MSDSYRAVYDATRSRISAVDTGHAIEQAAREAFDLSYQKQHLQQEIYRASTEMTRPCVLFRPRVFIDGDMWCALYGENLQDGVAGFGKSVADAMADFDAEWSKPLKENGNGDKG